MNKGFFFRATPIFVISLTVNSALQAQDDSIEEITVLGRQGFIQKEFTANRAGAAVDAAKLINQVPGGAATNNGPLTGQIQYRGMFGPRINVRVDGMLIHGGGPNWMAPPLHHIPVGLMENMVMEQGIASVTTGGGIGGAATAFWKRPAYNNSTGWNFKGDTEAAFGSVDSGTSLSGVLGVSSPNHRIYGVGSFDKGDDYESAEGAIDASEYSRDVYGFGYGFSLNNHDLNINYYRIDTDDTGTPSLPMDIDWFETDMWNADYRTRINSVGLQVRVYGSDIDHGMSNFLLRPAPNFSTLMLPPFVGDDKRMANTESEELGTSIEVDFPIASGTFILGAESKDASHNATVTDPDFAPFFVNNFKDVDVKSLAYYAEWSALFNSNLYVEAGIRLEDVEMDAGTVDAFPARLVDMNPAMWPMGTPPRAVWMLRQDFNNSDRSESDDIEDWVVKTRYQATEHLVLELGYAQKMRAPIYQERFLWIPLEANAGLGDGNNYVGNPMLNPEKSRQWEIGLDWDYDTLYFSPRLYHRNVNDFIQGTPAKNMAVVGVSKNANGDPTPLIFSNTKAEFEGLDMTFGFQIDDNWHFEGTYSSLNGDREDINDHLYRIMPNNLRLSVTYESNDFQGKIEQIIVADQKNISAANTNDPMNDNNSYTKTDGYSLTNIFLTWLVDSNWIINVGAENLFDEDYTDHLTGFNRVMMSTVPRGNRMFGWGRNLFGRVQYKW